MFKKLSASLLLVLLCLADVGCSAVQKPTASLKSATIGEATADGITVNFDLDLRNPNAFALPLGDADYALSLGGVKVIDDKLKPSGSIPAGGDLAFTLPVRLTFADLLKAERAIRA